MQRATQGEGWTLVLPGSLGARTGGTIYDRRMVEAARAHGARVDVIELPGGSYPRPDARAIREADAALARIPGGERVVVDGLALGALPGIARLHADRLKLTALVHHPLCDEEAESSQELLASERRALACVRNIVVTSEFTARRLRELDMLVPGIPVHVVEPGVDEAPPGEDWTPGTDLRLLSVGSLTPRKAHLDGLAALAARELPGPWRWTIVGREDLDPQCATELREAIEVAGLSEQIELTGEVPEESLGGHFLRAHVLLHTARYEGFGMVVTEALARGLPVIASTGGALGETLRQHGGVGLGTADERLAGAGYPPGDAGALRRQLADLLLIPERWSEWRGTALEARRKLPTWNESARSFSAVLDP
ncbi:Mannosylfructose-phosphate synthase [Planctomycetes bacterium Poly30]|uniref:Mannosylfructose-phosphate synthase n=1 Tax=Saltatorellus ferox TaxID=2528018 RepID=A0A518EYC2_9BACT|nr:Mannosylfructose-phosphate synthase [Planctomycetes bacterium Poly30]